jgi:RNA polymerase sigma factor (sigma-70 family)
MMTIDVIPATANTDAELVSGTLEGNHDAFGQIVSRYQSLICSLAYSATGSLGQSEDLAQETFITAWKHLRHLREHHKLRSWLCGIARNRINNFLRREGREPIREAESLENVPESHAPEPMPAEQTISNEEQAILWRSLERIPQIYREPLILFYREHQSVETVAQNLDLGEDAVKQRLSRGRKLLQEEVLNFVEGALGRTNPGKAFTLGVLAALPALTISAKAATVGAAAAKGSATAKAAGAMGLFSAIAAPLLVILGNYASYRMSMDEASSDEERGHIKSLFRRALGITLLFSVLLAAPLYWACRRQDDAWLFGSTLIVAILVIYFLVILVLAFATLRARRRHLAGLLADQYGGKFPPAAFEYRSRLSMFGLPLVHVRIGDRFDVLRGPVKAWVAIGSSHAVGLIFASGGLAIAPISFGGIAIGFLPFGAVAVGILAIGACSLGIWADGGLAIGWQVFGGCAIAWNAAMGGVAVAHDFALGVIARAMQANTDIARQVVQPNSFLRYAQMASNHSLLTMLIWVVPVSLQAWVVTKARRRREQGIV